MVSIKSLTFLSIFLILVSSCSLVVKYEDDKELVAAPTIKKIGGRVIKQDSCNKIDWDLESRGYSPSDGLFHIKGSVTSKCSDKDVDLAFISPVPFKSGSRFLVDWEISQEIKTEYSYFCDNPSYNYGWLIQGQIAFCNSTFINSNTSQEYEVRDIISVTPEYNITKNPNNATIYWNVSSYNKIPKSTDLTSNFNHIVNPSVYGNHNYSANFNLKQGIKYNVEAIIDVDKSKLPVKYTICMNNFCLDPTITNSRTWDDQDDFENNTILTNISAREGDLRLSNNLTDSLHVSYNWEGNTDDIFLGRWNGTVSGSASATPGKIGTAYSYGSGNGMNIGNIPMHNDTICISAWVKMKGVGVSNFNTFFGRTAAGPGNPGAHMAYRHNPAGGVGFYTGDGSNQNIHLNSQPVFTDQYHHYIFSLNGSQHLTYIDGVLNLSQVITTTRIVDDPSRDFYFGTRSDTAIFCDCDIDDISVFNKTCTIEDAIELYNNNKTNPYPFYRTRGLYEDLFGWSPQAGNSITNISVELITSNSGQVWFAYNKTNASLSTSAFNLLSSNGTNNLDLDMDVDDSIYFKILQTDNTSRNMSESPIVSSFTISEASVSPKTINVYQNSTQKGTADITHSISITLVTQANSMYMYSYRSDDVDTTDWLTRGNMTSGTNMTYNTDSSGSDVDIVNYIIEILNGGFVVEHGTKHSISNDTDVTVTSVNVSKALVIATYDNGGSTWGGDDSLTPFLSSATNLKFNIGGGANVDTAHWQVITYDGWEVQTGQFDTTNAADTVSISSVNLSKAFVISYILYSGNVQVHDIPVTNFTNSTALRFERSGTLLTTVRWYVIEFTDSTVVQSGTVEFGASDIKKSVTINTINSSSTFATPSTMMSFGHCAYSTDDNPACGLFTANLTSTTNIDLERAAHNSSAAQVFWQVIDMSPVVAAGDSCDTNSWDCTENCDVDGLDASGNTITATGGAAGDLITISGDITNCNQTKERIVRRGICEIRRIGNVKVCGT